MRVAPPPPLLPLPPPTASDCDGDAADADAERFSVFAAFGGRGGAIRSDGSWSEETAAALTLIGSVVCCCRLCERGDGERLPLPRV